MCRGGDAGRSAVLRPLARHDCTGASLLCGSHSPCRRLRPSVRLSVGLRGASRRASRSGCSGGGHRGGRRVRPAGRPATGGTTRVRAAARRRPSQTHVRRHTPALCTYTDTGPATKGTVKPTYIFTSVTQVTYSYVQNNGDAIAPCFMRPTPLRAKSRNTDCLPGGLRAGWGYT